MPTSIPELCDALCLPSAAAYERVRRDYQAFVAGIKARRRIRLGAHGALLFETAETVRAQILEVLHVEGRSPRRVLQVVAEYACLLPPRGELRATLFIDALDRDCGRRLGAAACTHGGLVLHAGGPALPSAPAEGEAAVADPAASESCVHYLTWRLADAVVAAGGPGRWGIRVATTRPSVIPLDEPLRSELRAELALDPPRVRPPRIGAHAPLPIDSTTEKNPWPF